MNAGGSVVASAPRGHGTDDPIGIGLVRPDLLGTYGDAGNAEVLQRRLEWRGRATEVVALGRGAAIPPHVKVLVLGGGEDRSQLELMDDRPLMDAVRAAADDGAAVFGVCAGLQLLGHSFAGPDGTRHAGLGLLDCTSGRLERRAVGECLTESAGGRDAGSGTMLTGFENHRGRTTRGVLASPLGWVTAGVGNGDGTDGAVSRSGRVIGTYLHGPVLARNPTLADRILESVLGPLPALELDEVERLRVERIAAARGWRSFRPRRFRPTVRAGAVR